MTDHPTDADTDEIDESSTTDDQDGEGHDRTTVYATDAAEEMSFAQIAMAAAKDPGVTVEDHPDGYLVDGKVFRPLDNPDTTDEYPVPPVDPEYAFGEDEM